MMKDLVSRQETIERFTMTAPQMSVIHIYEAVEILESIPPANQWIPVTERLPEKEGYYLLTVESLIAEAGSCVISRPYNGRGGFCDVYWNNVIAWMELPEPYKEDER